MKTKADPARLQTLVREAEQLHRSGDPTGALARYRKVLAAAPRHAPLLAAAALAAFDAGQLALGKRMLQAAVREQPDFATAWNRLGLALQAEGKLEEAIEAYDRVIKLLPGELGGYHNRGNALQLLERMDEAREAYKHALAVDADHAGTQINLQRVLVRLGRWEEVAELANRTLAQRPGQAGTLAHLSLALRELGRSEEHAALVDFDRLIQTRVFTAGPAEEPIGELNEALAASSRVHPSLQWEPSQNTTRLGHQTGNLMADGKEPFASLAELIRTAVADYGAEADGIAAAFIEARPAKWKLVAWATILGSQGHQSAHIHRDAWLSGVYYVRLPESIGATPESDAGWLSFGEPQPHPTLRADYPTRTLKPEEGTMVLFPSYFYHRTVPFEASSDRISIAFDVIPEK